MNNNIIINDPLIKDYLMYKLSKENAIFTKEDLLQIDELTINYNDKSTLKILSLFPNIKSLTIRNFSLYNNDFNILLSLSNLNSLYFEFCSFENPSLITSLSLKSLSLVSCNISDYSFIYSLNDLEELCLINASIDLNMLSSFNNLSYLQLSYSNIFNSNISLNLSSLEKLYIAHTNIYNLSFLNNLTNMKVLSIDKNQYLFNKDLITFLQSKGISILNGNITNW